MTTPEEDVHAQFAGKQCNVLYGCKDTTLLRGIVEEGRYAVCVVNVSHEIAPSHKCTEVMTYLASLYLGADDAPLYVLHVSSAGSRKLDISFGDTRHAALLVERIEKEGIAPFLRACHGAFSAPHCNMAYIYYDTVAELEQGQHTVVMGHNVPFPPDAHPVLHNLLLDVCAKQ